MDRETAVSIMDSVFKVNGIALTSNYNFTEDDIRFKATGYNETSKIGYVWLDNGNTAEDCFRAWGNYSYLNPYLLPKDKKEYDSLVKKLDDDRESYRAISTFLESLPEKNGYYKLHVLKQHLYGHKELQAKIQTYLDEHRDYDAAWYGLELLEQFNRQVVDLKEMEKLVDAEDYSVATFSKYSMTSAYFHSEDAKKESIGKLETLVQDYIDWARTGGRF